MSEHDEQVKLFQWAAHRLGVYPELALMFAIPNAGERRGSQGGWMVAEGLKRGVPDVCLPVARGGYHGLFLELKHGRNKATVEQLYWDLQGDAEKVRELLDELLRCQHIFDHTKSSSRTRQLFARITDARTALLAALGINDK